MSAPHPDLSPARDRATSLVVYLRDHRSGATAGVRLAARCRDHAVAAERAELAALAADISTDRDSLDRMMDELGIRPSWLKVTLAAIGERISRLKLNGRLLGRSPLAPLLEAEALAAGVFTKRNLWRALSAANVPGIDAAAVKELEARADDQLERLAGLHRAAAARALVEESAA
jgi:hypothetical protein